MRSPARKLRDDDEEGRITATGAGIGVLALPDEDEMREAIALLRPELVEQLKEFVARYDPNILVFPGPHPMPTAVAMRARSWARL